MADIFQEIEEDLRGERAQKFWKAYGPYVLGAAILIVVGVGGWRAYEWYTQQQAEAAGGRFEQALALSNAGKAADAAASFGAIAKDAPHGYQILARFRLAAEAGKVDKVQGVKDYDALAADATVGGLLQDLAKLRAAALLVDTAPYAEIDTRLDALAAPENPWHNSARELLGLSAWKVKDYTNASRWFEAELSDADVPSTLRQRAELMLQLIAADAPPKAAT